MENIKALRDKTGAGMVDCKKALDEAQGDLEKAIGILRKNGIAKAAKRTDRETNEGIIKLAVNDAKTEGYIVELNSETDFVARNEKFQAFGDKVLEMIKTQKPADLTALLGLVQEETDALSGIIGEKLAVKNFAILTGEVVAAYSHLGGRIGVLISMSNGATPELATEIAMQIAAANPLYISPEEVPSAEVEKEKDVYREQLKKEGKPENMIENILAGKLNKYYAEICLLKQEFIKDDKQSVEQILKGAKIDKFVRFSLS